MFCGLLMGLVMQPRCDATTMPARCLRRHLGESMVLMDLPERPQVKSWM